MSNKRLYITLGIIFISLTVNGCSQPDNSSVVPAFSNSVIEVEIPEPVDSLNDTTETDIDSSATGTDGKSNEEIEQELNEVEDITVEDTSNFSGGDVDYSNEPWYVEGIDYSYTNNGQGWDFQGEHYNTKGEYYKASYEYDQSLKGTDGWLTDEELEALANGEEIIK